MKCRSFGYARELMGIGLENPVHLVMLALFALLLFGPKRLPEIGRSLGRGLREFKTSLTGDADADPEPTQRSLSVTAPLPRSRAAELENDVAAGTGPTPSR